MANVDEKLRRGYDLVGRANGDPDALGVALLALHGALEEHLDETLRQLPALTPEERVALEEPGYSWSRRLELALSHGLVTRDQRQAILDANRQRNAFAHGGAFNGRQRELDAYAAFVAELVGARPTAPHVARAAARAARAEQATPRRAAPGPSRARASEGTTIGASAWNQRAAVRSTRRRELLPDSLPVRGAIIAAAVLVVALLGWRLISPPPEQEQTTAGAPLTPALTPAATLPPVTPSPVVRQARIVGLGGAIGFMHEPAGFSTPTLPPPLPEGTVLTLLDQPPVQAEGATWVKVAYGGYEGWVPANNVEEGGGAPTPDVTTPNPAP